MNGIALGIIMSHAPGLTARPELLDEARWRILNPALDEARKLLESAKPDLIVAFVNDHFQNFFLDGMPPFCFGIGEEHEIPSSANAGFLRLQPRSFKGDPEVARHLLICAMEAGFDPAFSEEMKFLDELAVPLNFLLPANLNIPIIPIMTNCVAPPLPSLRRCYELGSVVGRALSQLSTKRVVVLGTGGMSHWVGTPQSGRVNEEFDHDVLSIIENGRVDELLSWSDNQILEEGGNGAFELRNWVGALAAIGTYRSKVISYVPAPEWIGGIGVLALDASKP
jgi:protocatechuate 4,5-dioxygenase beta chain/2,3-dihydroxyphenylpropionate 1,2-dioxygenase